MTWTYSDLFANGKSQFPGDFQIDDTLSPRYVVVKIIVSRISAATGAPGFIDGWCQSLPSICARRSTKGLNR
jgi:hypothetical protein